MSSDFFRSIPLVSFDTTGLSGTYQTLDASGLPTSCAYITLNNDSNNDITISFDGVTDNDILIGGQGPRSFPLSLSVPLIRENGVWRKTQQIWVKSTTNTAGALYLSGYYL